MESVIQFSNYITSKLTHHKQFLYKKEMFKNMSMNREIKPIANNIAELYLILPPYNVAIQLNTFTAEGTAIINVKITKKLEINGFTPAINIW